MDHIGFTREPEFDLERRKQPNPKGASRIVGRAEHGSAIKEEVSQTAESLVERRVSLGIDPNRLLVLEVRASGVGARRHSGNVRPSGPGA